VALTVIDAYFQVCLALHSLGVSKEKFSSFVEHYIHQLESSGGKTRTNQDRNVDRNISLANLRGSVLNKHITDFTVYIEKKE